jgi:predicted phosphodiesterase
MAEYSAYLLSCRSMAKFAAVSDIHGNVLALRAVEEDLARRGVEAVIDLGDDASGPLWPLETTRALMERGWVHARGNHDRLIAQASPESLGPSDAYARRRLGEAERAWLGSHQPVFRAEAGSAFGCAVGFHGTPDDDEGYLVEIAEGGRVRIAGPESVLARLGSLRSPLVLCGHTHLQRCVSLPGGELVVNPGSVGLPGYSEKGDNPHIVESGSPHARYAILSDERGPWDIEFVLVEYDWDGAADKARAEGRPDWERALRTGYMEQVG